MSESFKFPLPPAILFNPSGTYGIGIELYTPMVDELPAGWNMEKSAEVLKRVQNYLCRSALTRVGDQTSTMFQRRDTTAMQTWTILLLLLSVVSRDEFQTIVKDVYLLYFPKPIRILGGTFTRSTNPDSPFPFTFTEPSLAEVPEGYAQIRAMQTLQRSFSAIDVLRLLSNAKHQDEPN
ncbi:hypothetical protein BD410DRAFT_794954 [Rickenella mellea]|uniref:Uncharacterized protein n=1 Tax=Rickenella mellea TaxID=50990 RepID=A0A4Y7PNS3_9AGAM|nr:hypothetical protein BD410DRAFT_794954 [Rickenella mellea]